MSFFCSGRHGHFSCAHGELTTETPSFPEADNAMLRFDRSAHQIWIGGRSDSEVQLRNGLMFIKDPGGVRKTAHNASELAIS